MNPIAVPDRRASLRPAPLPPTQLSPARSTEPPTGQPATSSTPSATDPRPQGGAPADLSAPATSTPPANSTPPIDDATAAPIGESSAPSRPAKLPGFIDVAPRLWVHLAYFRWYRWNLRVITKLRAAGVLHAKSSRRADEAGQSTVEYALVLLGAAAVALALVAWVTRSDFVSRLFDGIVGRVLSQAG